MDHPSIVMKILGLKNVSTESNKIALKMIKSVEFEVADGVTHVLNHRSPGFEKLLQLRSRYCTGTGRHNSRDTCKLT